ncbi:MAG: GNAT family N-acetyltransferase [Eubacterium sp.]|nr:GNAT family N-acetyltransferase [Eubacterium sp.]
MDFNYTTERLILKIENETASPLVLDFYEKNREFFEKYEPTHSKEFYTPEYIREIMRHEYKEALKLTALRYWLYEKSSGTLIGTVNFGRIRTLPYFSCEIGYKLSENAQHKGYATEALSFLINVINKDLNIHRFEAFVMQNNIPSLKLLDKLGFEQEGYIKDYVYLNDRWQDHLLYSKLL